MIPWICAAISSGLLIDLAISRHFYSKYYPAALFLSVSTCILLMRTFSDPFKIAKGFLFTESLICAGICDGLRHEIPNFLMIPIFAAGFIDFQPIPSIEGFFSVSLLFYLMARLTDGKAIGGGDIKLMAAAGCVLGLFGTVGGALLGMLLFLASHLVYLAVTKKKKQYYAMAPWLGTGCFLAYLLIPIGGIY